MVVIQKINFWFLDSFEGARKVKKVIFASDLASSSGASHILAVRSDLLLSSSNSAVVHCWEPSPDI